MAFNARSFPGQPVNNDDQKGHHHDRGHRPDSHSATHPSVTVVHHRITFRAVATISVCPILRIGSMTSTLADLTIYRPSERYRTKPYPPSDLAAAAVANLRLPRLLSRYCAGFLSNFSLQLELQKEYVCPACSVCPAALAASTSMLAQKVGKSCELGIDAPSRRPCRVDVIQLALAPPKDCRGGRDQGRVEQAKANFTRDR